ncbi:MAG: hypothetical protein K2Y27_22080 [Xanthobacteraceae bacterium]|nr:hypothetical protein [Xanthobacteraceae bacterium]
MSRHWSKRCWLVAAAITATAVNTPALAGDAQDSDALSNRLSHYIVQSMPPDIPVSGHVPPIKLTDQQRGQIRSALAAKNTEVSLELKANKSASSFQPQIGATIPTPLKPQAFPSALIADVPATRPYTYLKFKGQVLIVEPMSRKIVDLFPEASG